MKFHFWKITERQFCLLHFKNMLCDVIVSQLHIYRFRPRISSFAPNLSQSPSLLTSPTLSKHTPPPLIVVLIPSVPKWLTPCQLFGTAN